MQKIKGPGLRIVTGFAIMIALTLLISGWSYYHISTLGQSTENLFLANYRSIQYAGEMERAVENLMSMDSIESLTLDSSFDQYRAASKLAHNNITEAGEREVLNRLDAAFRALSEHAASHMDRKEQGEPVLSAIGDLVSLNEKAMFAKAGNVKRQANFARLSSLGITVLLCSAAIFLAVGVSRRSLAEYRELDLAKSNFVATAAHELKTPLSTIKTTADMLLDGLGGSISSSAHPLLQRVQQESTRLIALVSELLDLTKLDTGQFTLSVSEYKVSDLLESAAVQLSMSALSKGTEIDVSISPFDLTLQVDGNKIGHALTNLLSNAIKYADRATRIELRASQVDNEVWLAVSNRGKVIPENMKESIFNKFVQVESGSMGAGKGSGLGLAIAKEIVTLHRGRIWVESTTDGMTTFTIALPQSITVTNLS